MKRSNDFKKEKTIPGEKNITIQTRVVFIIKGFVTTYHYTIYFRISIFAQRKMSITQRMYIPSGTQEVV